MREVGWDLILEGGGSRCAFTAGALDYFLDKEIIFNTIYGVSASSLVAAVFMAKEKLASLISGPIESLDSKEEPGEGLVDMYEIIMGLDEAVLDLNFDRISKSAQDFYIVLLDAETGLAEYVAAKKLDSKTQLVKVIAASCAVPGIASRILIDNKAYYDGGFVDPIPVFRSYESKKNKKLVILTRNASYYKDQGNNIGDFDVDPSYPRVQYAMDSRHTSYNHAKDFALYMEDKSDGLVFMPSKEIDFDFLDFDQDKLLDLYKDGWSQAEKAYSRIIASDD